MNDQLTAPRRGTRAGPCDRRPLTLPAEDPAADALAGLAWALAHPARVKIVRLLLRRPTCVCGEIVEQLPLAQSTVSQHLKVLKTAGLIQGEVDGPKVCYCINRRRLDELKQLVAGLDGTETPPEPMTRRRTR